MSEDRRTGPGAAARSPAENEGPDQPRHPLATGAWPAGRAAPPPPREANDQLVTATITAGWVAALVVVGVLAMTGALPASERWWVWTCVAGVCLGLFGLWYVPLLKRGRMRAGSRAERSGQPSAEPSRESRESGSKTVSSTDTPGSSTRS